MQEKLTVGSIPSAVMKKRTLLKLVALVIILSVPYITYSTIGLLNSSQHSPPTNATLNGLHSSLFDSSMLGKLNLDTWKCRHYIGLIVDDMRIQKDWPLHPNERTVSNGLRHKFKKYSNYAFKMYGYLLTSTEGSYSFQIISRSTAALSVELWVSTSSLLSDISFLGLLEYPEKNRHYFSRKMSTNTAHVELERGQAYYIELHMKSFDGHGDVEIKWKVPGAMGYRSIPSHSLAMAVKLENSTFSPKQPNNNIISFLSKTNPSNELEKQSYRKMYTDSAYVYTDFNVLPECTFHSDFAVPQVVKGNAGHGMVHESLIYPVDSPHTSMYVKPEDDEEPERGNLLVPRYTISKLTYLYRKAFQRSKYTGKVLRARYIEETKNNDKGSRFLLEMGILSHGGTFYTSEYVYLATNSSHLCHTANFQWDRDVQVHLVVTVKNLGPWVRHLIQNLEQIFEATDDRNFELIIVDYMSTDWDIAAELQNSNLTRWKLVLLDGVFSRSRGLQAGPTWRKRWPTAARLLRLTRAS